MKKVLISTMIALMATNLGLYAQEHDVAQIKQEVKVELVWERDFGEELVDVAFDEQTLLPRIVIAGKSANSVRSVYFLDSNGIIVATEELKQYDEHAEAKLSQNGKFVATFEPVGIEHGLEAHEGRVGIFNSTGELLGNFTAIGGVDWLSNDGRVVIGEYLGADVTLRITSSSNTYSLSWYSDSTWFDLPAVFTKTWGDITVIGSRNSSGFLAFTKGQESLRSKGFMPVGDYLYWANGNRLYVVDESGDTVQEYMLNTSGPYSLNVSPHLKYMIAVQQKFRDVYLIDIVARQLQWQLNDDFVRWCPWVTYSVSDSGQMVVGEVPASFCFIDPHDKAILRHESPDDAPLVSTAINSAGNKIAIATKTGRIICYSVIYPAGGLR